MRLSIFTYIDDTKLTFMRIDVLKIKILKIGHILRLLGEIACKKLGDFLLF